MSKTEKKRRGCLGWLGIIFLLFILLVVAPVAAYFFADAKIGIDDKLKVMPQSIKPTVREWQVKFGIAEDSLLHAEPARETVPADTTQETTPQEVQKDFLPANVKYLPPNMKRGTKAHLRNLKAWADTLRRRGVTPKATPLSRKMKASARASPGMWHWVMNIYGNREQIGIQYTLTPPSVLLKQIKLPPGKLVNLSSAETTDFVLMLGKLASDSIYGAPEHFQRWMFQGNNYLLKCEEGYNKGAYVSVRISKAKDRDPQSVNIEVSGE